MRSERDSIAYTTINIYYTYITNIYRYYNAESGRAGRERGGKVGSGGIGIEKH